MKKTLTLIFTLTTVMAFSQNVRKGGWAEQFMVGANFTANSSWLFNSSITNQLPGSTDMEFSMGYSFGITGGYHYNQHIAFAADVQFFKLNQRYSGKENKQFWESNISLTGVQIPVYGKFMTKSGAFVEVGWQFAFITGASYNRGITNGQEIPVEEDQSKNFSTIIHSPHLGLGMDWYLNDMWVVTTAVRAHYGINDLKGVDGLGRILNDDPAYPDPQPTNAFTAGILIGFRYMIDAGGRY